MGLKYYSDERFFEIWSPTMAYVLGLLYADGSLEDASYLRGKYLRLSSTDKSLVNSVKKALRSQHNIVILPPAGTHKTRYFLRIGSHKIYNDLLKLGLFPNKSLTMKFPKVPHAFLPHFIRGYFDGDGHVSMEIKKGVFKRIKVIFVSGSLTFLTGLARELDNILGLRINRVYHGWRAYRLAYSTNDSLKIFKYIYEDTNGLFLGRKYAIFKKFFLKYNKWVDIEISEILNT